MFVTLATASDVPDDHLLPPAPQLMAVLIPHTTIPLRFVVSRAPTVPFFIYICSGPLRTGDFQSAVAMHGAAVMNIDLVIDPAHNVSPCALRDALCVLASHPLCLGGLLTVPCSSYFAGRFDPRFPGPAPVRAYPDHVMGIPTRPHGFVPCEAALHSRILTYSLDADDVLLQHRKLVRLQPRCGQRKAPALCRRQSWLIAFQHVRAVMAVDSRVTVTLRAAAPPQKATVEPTHVRVRPHLTLPLTPT